MTTIRVSANFYKILKNNLEVGVNKNKINSLIYNAIKYDGYLNENIENCIFEEEEESYQGVIINNDDIIYFSQILNEDFKTKSRNTFLAQNFFPIYNIAKKHDYKIKVSLNPISLFSLLENGFYNFKPSAASILISMLEMKFLGAEFSKSIIIDSSIFENNLESYLASKNKTKIRNPKNDGMFINYNNWDTIDVYGTLDGAKWGNTFLSCAFLSAKKEEWEIKKLNFIFYKKYTYKQKSNKIDFIKSLHYNTEDIAEITKNINIEVISKGDKEEIKRNQLVFRRNIEKEYNFKIQCFACNYNIKSNLISSHIHRVKDIIDSYNEEVIDKERAKKQIIDGLNGFLLCPNHDREFEKGIIYFDIYNYSFKINERSPEIILLKKQQKTEIVRSRLKENKLKLLNENEVSEEFESYVKQHQKRINIFNDFING